MKYIKILIVIFCLVVPAFIWQFFYNTSSSLGYFNLEKKEEIGLEVLGEEMVDDKISDIEKDILVEDGSTYGSLMKEAGVNYSDSNGIYQSSVDVYDLAKVRLGRKLKLFYDRETDEFKKFIYQIDSEDILLVKKNTEASSTGSLWETEIKKIEYDLKRKVVSGKIKSSLYEAALKADIDTRLIIELANIFQWNVDFAMDPRVGDTFKIVYEERYLDGQYVMPGRIFAARYVNAGENNDVYYFEESEDNKGYFDGEANSVQRMFLKAPVAFKYISSGFTTGKRYISAFHTYSSSHMAIDYAADIGTPIRAVGNGTVVSAYYNTRGYGNFLTLRHNGTYTTRYAHISKFAVKAGAKVKQGDIIAYVGNTGNSTGPHLHFEMIKNGVKINPLREVLPPGKSIKDENKERFFENIKNLQKEFME